MKAATASAAILFLIAVIYYVVRGSVVVNRVSSHATAEIQEISTALEVYKMDHGRYPTDPATTEQLKPDGANDPTACAAASAFLYRALSGSDDQNHRNYIPDFGRRKLRTDKDGVTRIIDPWENFVGYSTFKSTHPESPDGHNPTFDLWSTGGDARETNTAKWIKNW